MPKKLTVAVIAAAVLAAGGTAVAQTSQRFSDVPADHPAHGAVEWAAEVGLTLGYDDGTFKPDRPLSKRHAVVFMERFYDDILGADQSTDFTRGDMMMLLKAINDGASGAEPVPEPEGRWLPRPEGRTADGRCAHVIDDTDFYDWEDCAWGRHHDPVMSRVEMQTLTDRVWAETRARGKPASPPALVEGQCTERQAAACYFPGGHTISIESGVTRRSLLHELAHALITGDDTMADCYADWTHYVPHCAHGALFRCAADALFVRYGDIESAGVCGGLPDLGAWVRSSGDGLAGSWIEYRVEAPYASGDDGAVALTIRCTNDTDLRVAAFGVGRWHFRASLRGVGLIDYRFANQERPTRITAGSSDHNDDVWVVDDPGGFLSAMAADASGKLFIALVSSNRLEGPYGVRASWGDGTPTVMVEATLSTGGYGAHIAPRVAACS
ncbi:MAG: S-layer homology domain-containing protein [Acidimicrobiaceae bacterium]|nr:S-layer homology domain-containing protein [Acidimicrobiaceae bacterium]